MLYKCEHCNYTSNRLSNLVRHNNRLYPCNKTSKVNVCKREAPQELTAGSQDMTVGSQELTAGSQDMTAGSQDMTAETHNMTAETQEMTQEEMFKCSKCDKVLSRKDSLLRHEKTCDGYNKRQCKICLKIFATAHGKWNHTQYVKCSPPISPPPTTIPSSSSNTLNNITNNSHNNNNNNNINIDNSDKSVNTNNIQINIRADFDKITNDHIQNIVSQIKQADYLQMISDNIDIGKYVIPRTMEQIYFNDQFPEMQTLKKERRNDKLVGVHVGNGKWEKRLVDDIYNKIIGRVEDFHTKYFQFIEDKYKDVKVGSPRWKQIMRPIKTFGNTMLWYEGFSGDNIENMGIQLNYPDEDDEEMDKIREKRNKEMEQLISEKVYEETLSKEKATCIQ